MIYEGAPSRQLPVLATVTRDKLNQNFRCLYLNSPPMVAGMRSYLAAAGVDVEKALCDGHLQLSSVQNHLVDGLFNPDQMIHTLGEALQTALQDGYEGLWGDRRLNLGDGPGTGFFQAARLRVALGKLLPEASSVKRNLSVPFRHAAASAPAAGIGISSGNLPQFHAGADQSPLPATGEVDPNVTGKSGPGDGPATGTVLIITLASAMGIANSFAKS